VARGFLPAASLTTTRTRVNTTDINIPASGYEDIDPADLPKFQFDSVSLDMGHIPQGRKVTKEYHFTNAGKKRPGHQRRARILRLHGRKGLAQAARATRRARYHRRHLRQRGREGRQEKNVTVVANTSPPSNVLFLHGEVVAP
jgi:hypothetical protein